MNEDGFTNLFLLSFCCVPYLAWILVSFVLGIINKNKRMAAYSSLQIGSSKDDVISFLGKPSSIDNIEIYTSGKRERWVYGIKRKGCNYFHFENERVSKIIWNIL